MITKYKEKFGDQKSLRQKSIYLNQFVEFIGKDTLISNIKYADIDRYINHLRETPTYKKTPHTKRAINVKYSAVHQMFQYATNLELIKGNPLSGKETLRFREDKNTRQRFLSRKEINRLLAECKHDRDLFRRVVWALNTGMDHEDIQRVTWRNIRNHKIETYRSKLVRDGAKSWFDIPLNGETQAVLKEIKKEQGICPADTPVFKRRNITVAFQGAVRRANLDSLDTEQNVTFKTLRHTFASHLAMQGRHPKEIADLMGHRRIEQTMTYMHLAPNKKEEAVHSLNGLTGLCQKSDRFCQKTAEEARQY